MSAAPVPSTSPRRPSAPATPLWLIAIFLGMIATALVMQGPSGMPAAVAQTGGLTGARGVYAFAGQIDHNRFGLFMMDVDEGTVWCYEIDGSGPTRQMRLVAARSWIYDRYLHDFNCAEPSLRMIEQLVAQQRAEALKAARPDATTPDRSNSGGGSQP
ncbi:MAG: hypothetical protein CHACPFDD_00079 [Phycisphaerae bacterium]|nr:hypothetical protein [Phycisphaerae bacterium]